MDRPAMNIKLIRPQVKKNVCVLDFYIKNPLKNKAVYVAPPLPLAIVASLTPQDEKVSIIDENIEEIDFCDHADLVGITITSITAPRGYEIADTFRDKGVTVVLGGIHVGLMPKESLKHADSIIIGEAENLWDEVVRDFKLNKLKKVYRSKTRPDLKNLHLPRWDLLKNERYSIATIQLTRGCPHSCEFCVVKKQFGSKIRKRPVEEIIEEIRLLKKYYTTFWFVDYNLFFDKKYAKQLLTELIPLKISYICFANTYISEDDELLELLVKSGCECVLIGFETTNPDNLKLIKKEKINDIKKYPHVIEKIQGYGIQVQAQLVIGFDYDDINVFKRIEDFVTKNNIICPDIYIAGVFRGTKHYRRLKKEKRIGLQGHHPETCCKYGYVQWDAKSIDYLDLLFEFTFLYQRLYSYDAIFNRLKRFYDAYGNKIKECSQKNMPARVGFKKKLTDALLVIRCISKIRQDCFGISLPDLIRFKEFKRLKFVLNLLFHPKSVYNLYNGDFREIPGLLSKIERRNTFMYPFFFDEYLNHKMLKGYSHSFLYNNFNKSVKINLKSDIGKYIKKQYQHYKDLKFRKLQLKP